MGISITHNRQMEGRIMSRDRRVYIVGSFGANYCNWIEDHKIVKRMEDANLVLFTGGSDVSPSIYGKKAHPTTSNDWERDKYEIEEFNRAVELGLPILGVCRGSQLICCLNGGELIQHSRHPFVHPVKTISGKEIVMSSTHHQQAYIKKIADQVELIAWTENLSPYHFGEDDNDILDGSKEVEVAYYKNTNALGIQSHPEICYPPREDWEIEYIDYCRELLERYLEV